MNRLATLAMVALALPAAAQTYGLSATFGNGGAVNVDPGPGDDVLNTHLFLPDGKLLLTGTGYDINANSFHVSMIRIDTLCGALDPTFGTNGMVSHFHEQRTVCRSMALQSDGRIVGCGMVAPDNSGSLQWPGVYRYNADGSVDSTFNGTGYNRLPYDGIAPPGYFTRVFVNDSGAITCTGAGGANRLGVHRFTADGLLDATYGISGAASVALPNFSLSSEGTGLMLADSSVISIVIGYNGVDYNIEMAKFTSNGEPDSTFGTNGLVVSGIFARMAYDMGAALQPDGKIVVSCHTGVGDFLMVRFMPDGTTDTSYGTNGSSQVLQANSEGAGMQVLPDGSTLQFGRRGDDGTVLKRDVNGQVVTTFGTGGFQYALEPTGNSVFANGFVSGVLRILGYGGADGSTSFAARMTTTPETDALPVISVSGADLVTTGTGDMQWYLDGALINGATSNTYTPTENGDYTVEMSVSSECVFTSPVFSVLSVGMMDQASTSFRVLSNPVADVLVVLNDGAMTSYDVLGMNGKRIASGSLLSGRNTIDLSGAASGVYLLRATTDEGVQSQRIVKQ